MGQHHRWGVTVVAVVAGVALSGPAAADEDASLSEEAKAKEPGQGDFDAGGRVRLPSGPDEMGEFATFNWVAVDVIGRYFLLDSVTVNAQFPLAVIKPDSFGGAEPKMLGGMVLSFEAKSPQLPMMSKDTEARFILAGTYLREGAALLSEKDFPLFLGDLKPGVNTGLNARVKLSSAIDFQTTPMWVYQSGTDESLTAVQIPLSLVLAVGDAVKVSADAGIFTGDDYSFSGDEGGRIAAGGSLSVKIGPIITHAGAGVATLLTGGLYPTIGDSVYIDLNVKYAK